MDKEVATDYNIGLKGHFMKVIGRMIKAMDKED